MKKKLKEWLESEHYNLQLFLAFLSAGIKTILITVAIIIVGAILFSANDKENNQTENLEIKEDNKYVIQETKMETDDGFILIQYYKEK